MNVVSRQTWYQEWFNSPFYHKLYFDNNEEESLAFLHKLIQHTRPAHGSRILDINCGRGRHSQALASLGFNATGIDIAPDTIAIAGQAQSENPQFFTHDIRLPFWINYFDYAFNLFTRFGYYKTRREHDDAIRTIAGGLRPGGVLIIDYLNVHYAEQHIVHNEIKQIGFTTYDIQRWDDDTHFFKKITITDPSLQQPLTFTEKLVKFSLGDFTDTLSFQSMQVEEVFGDYSLSPYDIKKTPRLIIVARKKRNESADKEKRLYSDGRSTDALT
jgi:SAM-dependent methyltransferase